MSRKWGPPHLKYARDIVKGRINASKLVRLACQKSLDEHVRARKDPAFPWMFDPDEADAVCAFLETMPHIQGKWAEAGVTLTLEPWQRFFVSELYGWLDRSNPYIRRYREGLLEVAKKNGKSFLCAGLGLHALIHGDEGAQVYSVATKRDQAKIVFDTAAKVARKMDGVNIRETNLDLTYQHKNSVFKPLAREHHTQDGLNPSMTIVDEAASITKREVIESMTDAVGARDNPITLYITTAQQSMNTAYYEKRTAVENLLTGKEQNERLFGMVYHCTEDDWNDPAHFVCANPNIGVSVDRTFLDEQVADAERIATKRTGVKRKNFNVWVGASDGWIEPTLWARARGRVDRSGPCVIGVDMASTRNLCAVTRMWQNRGGKISVDFRCWLPRKTYAGLMGQYEPIYEQAVESGVLVLTTGEGADYDEIEGYIRETLDEYDVTMTCLDTWQSGQLARNLREHGHTALGVGQSMAKLSWPTKQVEMLLLRELLVHDGNPFIAWQMENARLYEGPNQNVKVVKPDEDHPIDSIVAMINASAGIDAGDAEPEFAEVSFYSTTLATQQTPNG